MTTDAPKTTTCQFTRGAAYLLEGILQDPRPCDTPVKTAKWAKLYGHIRRANDRTITVGDVTADHEKIRNKLIRQFPVLDEKDPGFQVNQRKLQEALIDLEDANEAWRQQEVTVELTRKQLDTAKAAVEYRCKNQDMSKGIVMPNNEHSLNLLVQLGLDEE